MNSTHFYDMLIDILLNDLLKLTTYYLIICRLPLISLLFLHYCSLGVSEWLQPQIKDSIGNYSYKNCKFQCET